jgi:hypothetical protein
MQAASLVFLFLVIGGTASTQSSRVFKARLAPVPIDVAMQATVAGLGTASASLTGTHLTVTGSFDGLKSPATFAKIRKSAIR